jgi:hypothetical protein
MIKEVILSKEESDMKIELIREILKLKCENNEVKK